MLEAIGGEIMIKFLTKHWKSLLSLGLIVALFFSVQSCKKYEDEYLIAQNNYESALDETRETVRKEILTRKQLSAFYKRELEVLRDSLAIKPKTIERLQVIKTVERDTVVSVINESFNGLNLAEFSQGCTEGTFVWVDGDSLGTFTITNNNSFLMVDHWERKRLFGWGWTPKWGRKFGKVSVINECANDTILENKVIEVR